MDIENTGAAFVVKLGKRSSAELAYHIEGDVIYLDSTFTPEEFRGKGIGGKLVEASIAYAKEKGLKVVPVCPFAAEFFKRHPEHSALLKE